MKIEELFQKNIYRNINGVIKVEQDDYDNVYQELDEYVVTKEMDKHFHDFFSSYIKSLDYKTDKIGVWVSGFFGSGKSHFIKILSYLLANKKVDGKTSLDFFQDKFQDEMLLSDIKRIITKGTTDVILFNIDSKSDALNKADKEGIVKVFMKVMDDMQGYCGEIPWLAGLERQLDKRGEYSLFKDKYKEITGQDWVENRGSFYFESENIIKALTKSTSMSEEAAAKWFDTGEKNYTLSIEKFAKILMDYCNSRGDHRVIFLVDEIGQYIGDNTDLMLNLQTITEDLGRMLNGKAWIVVTSQEAIDSITKLKGRDFSKIKGRFSTQLNLSSDNTDEVIKKRILEKKGSVKDYLSLYYDEKKATLRNLIIFSSGTAEMKSYASSEEFSEVYPFIPYQFNLVQKVFEQIRRIGATGAHLSEGERSMLSAFQEAAKATGNDETGKLAPFSIFYRSIETFLHSGIKRTINQASENRTLKPEDIELLKILFMIKYIKEMRPNVENLTTLCIAHIDEDKRALRESIRESLERLVSQTLVSKNGDEYEFLTDEEQEIERKIRNTEIEGQNVIEYAGNIIFDDIYKDKKYKYSDYNNYSFNSQIDDFLKGSQGHELSLKIVTPWNDNYSSGKFNVIMNSTDSLLLKLPEDDEFLEEIKKMLQIEQFIRTSGSLKSSETVQKIINGKKAEIHKIKERIKLLIENALSGSRVYLCGDAVDIKGSNAKDIINNSFSKMVENIYSKVGYISNHFHSAVDLMNILNANDMELFNLEECQGNKLAEEEIKTFVENQHKRSLKTTVKIIKDKYMKKPYGWSDIDIAGLIASLFARGILKIKYNHEDVTDKKEIPDYLTKKDYGEKILIDPKPVVPIEDIMQTKKIMMEAFGSANLPDDADSLAKKVKDILNNFYQELKEYRASYHGGEFYPGKALVDEGIGVLDNIKNINDEQQFFKKLIKDKENLLDITDDIEPVRHFFKSQIKIFDKSLADYKRFHHDKYYLSDEGKAELKQMDDIFHMEEPYKKIKELPLLAGKIEERHKIVLNSYRTKVNKKIEHILSDIKNEFEKHKDIISADFQRSILSYYERILKDIDKLDDCTKLEALTVQIDNEKHTSLQQIEAEVKKKKEEKGIQTQKTRYVKLNEVSDWTSPVKTEEDLNSYLKHLKDKLKKIIDNNEVIKFI